MEKNTQFVGQSLAFLDAVEQAGRAAELNRPVLVIGERGTGKELIAERLHHLSPRWGEPLITMNCAALPETLIEAELFGHEQGAFAGAFDRQRGLIEHCDGGTLILDWRESGGPSVATPDRTGFGSRLIQRGLGTPGSQTTIKYLPDGLHCRLEGKLCL